MYDKYDQTNKVGCIKVRVKENFLDILKHKIRICIIKLSINYYINTIYRTK